MELKAQLAWDERARRELEAGDPEKALAAIRDALEAGELRRIGLLDDPAFDPLRRNREFGKLQTEAVRRVKRLKLQPELIGVPPANGDRRPPLVLGLHGAGSSAAALIEDWRAASNAGYLLVAAQSSQPVTEHSYCWDDPDQVRRDLGAIARRVTREFQFDPDRVVVAGFSQGAAVASRLAIAQSPLPVRGFLVVAPSLGPRPPDGRLKLTGLRGAAVIGGDDTHSLHFPAHEASWRSAGAEIRVEFFPGLGHTYPEGFAELLPELLAWTIG